MHNFCAARFGFLRAPNTSTKLPPTVRTIFTLLLFTILCTGASAQGLFQQPPVYDGTPAPITYERRFLGTLFYYDNLQVTTYNFRRAMYQDAEALQTLTGSGFIEIMSIISASTGALVINYGLFSDEDALFDDQTTNVVVATGLLATGLVLQGVANRKRIRAVNIYNRNLGFEADGYPALGLDFGATQHGLGLTATF